MTRIYTIGLEHQNKEENSYLVVLVAHRDSRRAIRAALSEAIQHGGPWRVAHLAKRRTGVPVPLGEILGAAGPFTCKLDQE